MEFCLMKNKSFLIADDDSQFRQLMEEILLKVYPDEEIIIHHAETGAEAISIFKSSLTEDKPVDIVITDYAMPEATGSEVIDFIIQKHPVPIVVVSAVAEAHSHDFIQEGAIYFLPKPFDIETAKNVIHGALELNVNPDEIQKAKDAITRLKSMNL